MRYCMDLCFFSRHVTRLPRQQQGRRRGVGCGGPAWRKDSASASCRCALCKGTACDCGNPHMNELGTFTELSATCQVGACQCQH